MNGLPNIHRGVHVDLDTDQFVWCENCGDGHPTGDPMIDLDGQPFCSTRCLREHVEMMDDATHDDLVGAYRSFADRIAAIAVLNDAQERAYLDEELDAGR